jgi:hypothetical protein
MIPEWRKPGTGPQMPTIPDISGPYRFFFYSFDCNEPRHVHVERDKATSKFWLEPLALARNNGFSPHELTRIRRFLASNIERISDAWDEHCGHQ